MAHRNGRLKQVRGRTFIYPNYFLFPSNTYVTWILVFDATAPVHLRFAGGTHWKQRAKHSTKVPV